MIPENDYLKEALNIIWVVNESKWKRKNMIAMYPKYEGLVSFWPAGKLGSIRTYQLSKDITAKIFPDPKTPTLDEIRTKFILDAGIFSKPLLRNARLSNFSGSIRMPPLTSTDGLSVYTVSMKKLREGYWVDVLTRGYYFDVFF